MFAIVKVELNYDFIEGVECIAFFQDQKEAENFLLDTKNKALKISFERNLYIEEYVKNFNYPKQVSYQEWSAFIKNIFGRECIYILPQDFEKTLRHNLLQGYDLNIEGFYPPKKLDKDWNNVFIMEIKEPTNLDHAIFNTPGSGRSEPSDR